jgi:hypothetical protein
MTASRRGRPIRRPAFYAEAESCTRCTVPPARSDRTRAPTAYPHPRSATNHGRTVRLTAWQQGLHLFHMANGVHLTRWLKGAPTPPPTAHPPHRGEGDAETALSGRRWSHRQSDCRWARTPAGCTPAVTAYRRRREAQVGADGLRPTPSQQAEPSIPLYCCCVRSPTSIRGDWATPPLLGVRYMVHNSTFFMAVNPARRNQTAWQRPWAQRLAMRPVLTPRTRSATSRCSASCELRWSRPPDLGRRCGR